MNHQAVEQFLERARKSGIIEQMRSASFVVMCDGRADLPMVLQLGTHAAGADGSRIS